MIRIHNTQTGELIDREMNDAEFAIWEVQQDNLVIEKTEAITKEANKKAILDRIGLTAEELKTILG